MPEAKVPLLYTPLNRMLKIMNGLAVPLGPVRMITVQGRASGQPRSTPIAPVTLAAHRYVVSGLKDSNWAKNARAAGRGQITKGRKHEAVTLKEVTNPQLRGQVMSVYPVQVPTGIGFFKALGVVTSGDPAEFAAGAGKVAIFEVTPVNAKP